MIRFLFLVPLVLWPVLSSASPQNVTLFGNGLQQEATVITGKFFRINDGDRTWSRFEYLGGEAKYTGNFTLKLGGGVVELGKYSGVGHVLCDGFWVTYERQLFLSRPGGFFVLRSPTQEQSKDPTNENAMLYCALPSASGEVRSIIVGAENVVHAEGNLRCARGGLKWRANGIPPSDGFSVKYNYLGIEDPGSAAGVPFIISGLYSEKMGRTVDGTVEIPNKCRDSVRGGTLE